MLLFTFAASRVVARACAAIVSISFATLSSAQLTDSFPLPLTRAALPQPSPLLQDCLARYSETPERKEFRTLAGSVTTLRYENGRIKSVANGTQTATARYDGARLIGIELSNGQVVPFRAKLTPQERAVLPDKIKHLKRLVGRKIMQECHSGSVVGSIAGQYSYVGDGQGEWDNWDDAWSTNEFWDGYYASAYSLTSFWAELAQQSVQRCTIVASKCRDQCDSTERYSNWGCGVIGGVVAAAGMPWLGVALAAACGLGVIELSEDCRQQCTEPSVVCTE